MSYEKTYDRLRETRDVTEVVLRMPGATVTLDIDNMPDISDDERVALARALCWGEAARYVAARIHWMADGDDEDADLGLRLDAPGVRDSVVEELERKAARAEQRAERASDALRRVMLKCDEFAPGYARLLRQAAYPEEVP